MLPVRVTYGKRPRVEDAAPTAPSAPGAAAGDGVNGPPPSSHGRAHADASADAMVDEALAQDAAAAAKRRARAMEVLAGLGSGSAAAAGGGGPSQRDAPSLRSGASLRASGQAAALTAEIDYHLVSGQCRRDGLLGVARGAAAWRLPRLPTPPF
jgi:hypothetical protein